MSEPTEPEDAAVTLAKVALERTSAYLEPLTKTGAKLYFLRRSDGLSGPVFHVEGTKCGFGDRIQARRVYVTTEEVTKFGLRLCDTCQRRLVPSATAVAAREAAWAVAKAYEANTRAALAEQDPPSPDLGEVLTDKLNELGFYLVHRRKKSS